MNTAADRKIVKVGQSSKSGLFAIPFTLAGVGAMFIVFMLALSASIPGLSWQSTVQQSPFGSNHDLKKFSSYENMVDFLSKAQAYFDEISSNSNYRTGVPAPMPEAGLLETTNSPAIMEQSQSSSSFGATYGTAGGVVGTPTSSAASSTATSPAPQSPVAAGAAAAADSSFSTTNLQVAGVDEPDFLKNDGKYVYILSGDKLTIVHGYPAKDAAIISKVSLDVPSGQAVDDMFLNGDRLVIFYQSDEMNNSTLGPVGGGAAAGINNQPVQLQSTHTHVLVVDVSDRANPKVDSNFDVTGQYNTARMIGSQVFLLTVDPINDYRHPVQPSVQEQRPSGGVAATTGTARTSTDVYYFEDQQQNFAFNTVSVFDLDKVSPTTTSSNKTGLLVASKSFMIGSGATVYVSNDAMYIAYQTGSSFVPARGFVGGASVPVPMPFVRDNGDSTIVHRISIAADSLLEYAGRAEVPGHLLNQFSMGEQDGRFTVATTSENSQQSPPYGGLVQQNNNVYTFDNKMNLVGKLEGLEQGESIYSARFMGDKLYLVTFQRLDPFLVIDLSHNQPQVLGKLQLPGFSDYLQPYDATHVVGIGRDAVPNPDEQNLARPTGMKVALFDVSDVHKPKLVGSYSFGDSQTNSEALNDHKAVLLDKIHNILVIPVSSVGVPNAGQYGLWFGFYVFGISPSEGVNLKGTIEHSQDGGGSYYYYDGSQSSRSFFINDTLYTVSPGLMKMNSLTNISDELNSLDLAGSGEVIKGMG